MLSPKMPANAPHMADISLPGTKGPPTPVALTECSHEFAYVAFTGSGVYKRTVRGCVCRPSHVSAFPARA